MAHWDGAQGQAKMDKITKKHSNLWRSPEKSSNPKQKFFFFDFDDKTSWIRRGFEQLSSSIAWQVIGLQSSAKMAHPGLKGLKLLPAHVIPFPLYPLVQEHEKLPTMLVHDPPVPGFAQLSMPNAHSSISVIPINGRTSKVIFKRFLIQAAEYDSIRSHYMKFFRCVRRATEPSPAEEKRPQVRFG